MIILRETRKKKNDENVLRKMKKKIKFWNDKKLNIHYINVKIIIYIF